MEKTQKHVPVLKDEIIGLSGDIRGEIVVDATLGGGGHALALMEKMGFGTLVVIDVDSEILVEFKKKLVGLGFKRISDEGFIKNDIRVFCKLDNFANLGFILKNLNIQKGSIKFMMADLGFSTIQLNRDLSFKVDGELDLRMDKSLAVKASDLVNGLYRKELERLFKNYGDITKAREFANFIIQSRKRGKIETKFDLGRIVEQFEKECGAKSRGKMKARVFQALRIAVNDEYNTLQKFLDEFFTWLATSGRFGIISFHSGEDRIVKKKFKTMIGKNEAKWIEPLLLPSSEEVKVNPKSRSAKFRMIEKTT